MRLFIVMVLSVLSSFASATQPIECQFSERLSADYEDINDFSFNDYPWLLIKESGKGWEVTVGGITYGDEYSATVPEQIDRTETKNNEIVFENRNLNEHWIIQIDSQTNTALFSADLGSSSLTEIAKFKCQ